MNQLSLLTPIEIIYFIILALFIIFFGFKGILQSLGFTIKIVGSITIPFISYKKVIALISDYFYENEFFTELILNYSLISEVLIFIIIFLSSYAIFGILEKILNLNFTKNFYVKVLDFILGTLYGIFLFTVIFYLSYNLILKNYLSENMHSIMNYNIEFYDNLRYEQDVRSDNLEDINLDEENAIY